MSKLHKKIRFSLVQKMYCLLLLLAVYGWYKNGLYPVVQGFYSYTHVLLIALFPLLGFFIGWIFDYFFKNNCMFNHRFYGLLFSLLLPISTPIGLFVLFLVLLLFFHTFIIQKKDLDFNFIVFGKLAFVLILFLLHTYSYANQLEQSNLYLYSFVDTLFGHTISGMFTSPVLMILFAFVVLAFDPYYKKEIPFYSYGVYFVSLLVFSIMKSDMSFLLTHLFSSTILFVLVFLAPLSLFSPYSAKRKIFYSVFLGISILPCSFLFNFYEGVYISLFLANLLIIILNVVQKKLFSQQN